MNDSGTSSIGEYRVLWTNRKSQKVKYWQDGQLRFHRFNGKAMLYDDSKNLVDQLFISRGTVEMGEEIEFDCVLVSIEEFEKEVLRDLSEVVRKKTPAKPLISERLCRTKSHPKRGLGFGNKEVNIQNTTFARPEIETPRVSGRRIKTSSKSDKTTEPRLALKEIICIDEDQEVPTDAILEERRPIHNLNFHQIALRSRQHEVTQNLETPLINSEKPSIFHARRNTVLQSIASNRGPSAKGKEKAQLLLPSPIVVDSTDSSNTSVSSKPAVTAVNKVTSELQPWDEVDYGSDFDLQEDSLEGKQVLNDDQQNHRNIRVFSSLWDTPEAHDLFSWRPPGC